MTMTLRIAFFLAQREWQRRTWMMSKRDINTDKRQRERSGPNRHPNPILIRQVQASTSKIETEYLGKIVLATSESHITSSSSPWRLQLLYLPPHLKNMDDPKLPLMNIFLCTVPTLYQKLASDNWSLPKQDWKQELQVCSNCPIDAHRRDHHITQGNLERISSQTSHSSDKFTTRVMILQ